MERPITNPPALYYRFATIMRAAKHGLYQRSVRLTDFLGSRINSIAFAWLAIASCAAIAKIATARSPVHDFGDLASLSLPYLLIILSPLAGYWVASASFPSGAAVEQPRFRFALYGRWRQIDAVDARRSTHFGPTGLMASLLLGLLLNVPVRLLEFVAAVPAMNGHAPAWGQSLFWATALEMGVMSFLYMACFVMALRNVPLFPRMLAYVWSVDILAQLCIAQVVTRADRLPPAVAAALEDLLNGNIQKVLISAFVWLPYLLLSPRVNLTYRNRIRAT